MNKVACVHDIIFVCTYMFVYIGIHTHVVYTAVDIPYDVSSHVAAPWTRAHTTSLKWRAAQHAKYVLRGTSLIHMVAARIRVPKMGKSIKP